MMNGDWVECTLGEFMEKKGNSLNPKKYLSETLELYSVPNHSIKKPEIKKGKDIGSSKQIVDNNWVLLSRINPHLNRSWVIKSDSNLIKIASSEWVKFPPTEILFPEYLGHFLTNTGLKNYMCLNVSGVGGSLTRTNKNAIREYPFSLPPLPIQRAIVTKIEELFSSLDNGIADLKKAQVQLKIYRQAIIVKAVTGEFTATFRKKNPELPDSETDYNKIQIKIDEAYAIACAKAKEEGRRKPKSQRSNKKAKNVVSVLPEIPKKWKYYRLEDLTHLVTDGTHYTPKYKEEGVKFLSVKNVRPFFIRGDKMKFISQEEHEKIITRCKPENGDILYTKVGATYGYACKVDLDYEFSIYVSLCLIKPVKEYLKTDFLELLMNSELVFKQARQRVSGSGVPDLHLVEIRDFKIPLPSVEEQDEIIRQMKYRLSVCDKVEESIAISLKKAEALRQSILKKAFEGKLLSSAEVEQCKQAADYEPASVLLEKIKK